MVEAKGLSKANKGNRLVGKRGRIVARSYRIVEGRIDIHLPSTGRGDVGDCIVPAAKIVTEGPVGALSR